MIAPALSAEPLARGRFAVYPYGMGALPDIARAATTEHDMLPEGAVVLAMVSGGADSVAMLRLLAGSRLGDLVGRLHVVHVNHLLRGDDADADASFVSRLCDTLGVPCTVARYDVAAYADAEGLNLEDAGRRVRYRVAEAELDTLCDALGTDRELGRIAVAHTFDDRLETYLARIVTGAGAAGLASIAPVRGRIVRPLIAARRDEVTAYLEALGQAWRDDATNADTSRERAWVRHELLPVIERRNPSFASVAARTMALLAEDDRELSRLAGRERERVTAHEGGALGFERDALSALPPALARRVVRSALLEAFPEASRLEFEHIDALVAGASDPSFARDLPFGLRAGAEYGKLRVSRQGDVAPSVAPGLLELPGTLDCGAAGVIEARISASGGFAPGPDAVSIDADTVSWPLAVDAPREGDRLRPLGLGGTKKLSDVLIDAKVPRRTRGAVPVVRDGDRIVWVAGVTLAEECRVRPDSVRVAELEWRRPPVR